MACRHRIRRRMRGSHSSQVTCSKGGGGGSRLEVSQKNNNGGVGGTSDRLGEAGKQTGGNKAERRGDLGTGAVQKKEIDAQFAPS